MIKGIEGGEKLKFKTFLTSKSNLAIGLILKLNILLDRTLPFSVAVMMTGRMF